MEASMTKGQFAVHDSLREAVLHLEKAKGLMLLQDSYSCKSVDLNAVEVTCRMLENLCGVLKDVDRSILDHSSTSLP
jgi:hypothetical protein